MLRSRTLADRDSLLRVFAGIRSFSRNTKIRNWSTKQSYVDLLLSMSHLVVGPLDPNHARLTLSIPKDHGPQDTFDSVSIIAKSGLLNSPHILEDNEENSTGNDFFPHLHDPGAYDHRMVESHRARKGEPLLGTKVPTKADPLSKDHSRKTTQYLSDRLPPSNARVHGTPSGRGPVHVNRYLLQSMTDQDDHSTAKQAGPDMQDPTTSDCPDASQPTRKDQELLGPTTADSVIQDRETRYHLDPTSPCNKDVQGIEDRVSAYEDMRLLQSMNKEESEDDNATWEQSESPVRQRKSEGQSKGQAVKEKATSSVPKQATQIASESMARLQKQISLVYGKVLTQDMVPGPHDTPTHSVLYFYL